VIQTPYVTRKKIRLVHERPLLLKVDLDDDKFPKHYALDYGIKTLIRGTVSLLVDQNYYVKCFIKQDYEFQVNSTGHYVDSGSKCVYDRYLTLPKKLVSGYAIDAGMGIELILREVDIGGEVEKIFSEKMEQGSMDFEPKGLIGEELGSSESLITTDFPEKYYVDLVSEINNAFRVRLFTATMILVRKLFENLIIDLLRHRFGMQPPNLEIFYSEKNHRFHNLSTLIQNLGKRIDDFGPYTDAWQRDKDQEKFMKFLKDVKEEGDAKAHSLEFLHDPQTIIALKPSINEYNALIVRIIQIIEKYSQKQKT
jgi:hypothetical protein